MITSLERLRDIALNSAGFINTVQPAMREIMRQGGGGQGILTAMADTLCQKYALCSEVHPGAVVLYPTNTRAKQPPCITVSLAAMQRTSLSSVACYWSAFSLIQVFDGGADDRQELVHAGEDAPHWIETKGRVLFV